MATASPTSSSAPAAIRQQRRYDRCRRGLCDLRPGGRVRDDARPRPSQPRRRLQVPGRKRARLCRPGVSGAGDVNGDGFDDLLVGAPRNGTGGYNAGADFIIFGRPDNVAPDGTDATLTIGETARAPAAADFGFTDCDGDLLLAVTITTLPDHGMLYFDADGPGGNDAVAVTAGQSISAADIAAGHLTFAPAPDANGAGYASFTFQVQDDGGVVARGVDLDPSPNTITFDVTPVNDAPTSTNLAGDVASFTEGGAAVALDVGGNATIADIDSTDFDSGTLTVAVTGNAAPGEDCCRSRTRVSGAGQIGVAGNAVSFGGVQFATFTGGSGGNPLVFTFDADATPAAVQALVRDIFYATATTPTPRPWSGRSAGPWSTATAPRTAAPTR